MSPIAFVLLLLSVASAQPDALSVSPKRGPCLFGQTQICPNTIPTICFCAPTPPQPPSPVGCICPAVFAPVCGRDGRTYGNSCEAGCSKVKVACNGKCPCPSPPPPPGCVCSKIFDPVCGKDGKTYSNPCLARCGGTTVDCKGGCPCGPPSTPSEINEFLEECEKTGEAASVAAASAACSTVLLRCPVTKEARADGAAFSKASSFNPAEALLEKVLEGACLLKAENACKSKAINNISDSDCRRILDRNKCSSGEDPGQIFKEEVEQLCKRK